MLCYGYGLKENEVDKASPRFISLFLRGNVDRENEAAKRSWEQARFIASSMSREAGKVKFPWERIKNMPKIADDVWDKFTFDTGGKPAELKDLIKYIN